MKVIEPLLSCGTCNKDESQPSSLQGKLPGVLPEKELGKFPYTMAEKTPRKREGE
jgi:hypothetical protein